MKEPHRVEQTKLKPEIVLKKYSCNVNFGVKTVKVANQSIAVIFLVKILQFWLKVTKITI